MPEKRRIIAKLFLLLILFCRTAYADVVVEKQHDRVLFGDKIEYYEDRTGVEFPEFLKMNPQWKRAELQNINFGVTDSVYWLRFNIDNRTGRDLYLTFNTINFDSIKLYNMNDDGSYIEKTGGSIYPFSHREIWDKDIFFIIPERSGINTVYARLSSNYVITILPEVVADNKVYQRALKVYIPYFINFGILIALFLYNLIIYLSSREKLYKILISIIFGFALYDLANDGIGFMFLWPESVYFENIAIPLSLGLVSIANAIFFQVALDTRKNHPVIHQIFNLWGLNGFLISVLCFFLGKGIMVRIIYLFIIQSSLSAIGPMVYLVFFKKNRTAAFLFAGWIMLDIAIFFASASASPWFIKHFPFLNDTFTLLNVLKFSRAWVVIVFSLIIADKINLMKRQLEISEESYRSIYNGTNEAIVIADIETFDIVDCNVKLLSMLNLKYEDIIGKTHFFISGLIEGFSVKKAHDLAMELKKRDSIIIERHIQRTTGESFWGEITLTRITLNGVLRIMAVIRDISERKKSEEERVKMMQQLAQTQRMEAVSSLSGGLAHDFNNILTGILGSSSIVEKKLEENNIDREQIKKYITIIKESSIKAASTVRRLLTLTRKTEMNFTSVDLNVSLKNVVDICSNSFPKSVELRVRYYDTPAIVNADLSGLEQVLLNLMVNASHAVTVMRGASEPEGGIISAKIDRQYADDGFMRYNMDAEFGTYYYSVSIQDNGCGIAPENINKIFDPFFTTKGNVGGSGLGLSMVYNIVKQHKGLIKVYSENGEGCTFIIFIPEYLEGKQPERVGEEKIVKGRGRILVIDDEEYIITIAREILEECGYEVITASGGNEGVDKFRQNPSAVDAVLLDTSMPGLSGLDTFKAIKEISGDALVIMSSGFGMDERAQKALDSGADFFIQKPYTNIQLSGIMHQVLKSRGKL